MTLNEIADLILLPQSEFISDGNYCNRRNVKGYYLRVKYGDYWCNISVSSAGRHADRITVGELDEIHLTRKSQLIVPVRSLAHALRSRAAEQAPVNKYLNRSNVEGIWAEFYHNGNWYMVSVSHVEVPASATPAELDRLADEFLRQQGGTPRRRRIA